MAVKTARIKGRLRTVEADTGRIAKTSKGNPRDGDGWPDTPKGRGRAERQMGHINEGERRKRRKELGI